MITSRLAPMPEASACICRAIFTVLVFLLVVYSYILGSGDCEATTAKPCDYVPCSNGVCNSQTGLCDCNAGYTGSLCQHSIDDCAGTTCINGDCVDGHMTATCSCLVGYTG